jgi:hypothetical protein
MAFRSALLITKPVAERAGARRRLAERRAFTHRRLPSSILPEFSFFFPQQGSPAPCQSPPYFSCGTGILRLLVRARVVVDAAPNHADLVPARHGTAVLAASADREGVSSLKDELDSAVSIDPT